MCPLMCSAVETSLHIKYRCSYTFVSFVVSHFVPIQCKQQAEHILGVMLILFFKSFFGSEYHKLKWWMKWYRILLVFEKQNATTWQELINVLFFTCFSFFFPPEDLHAAGWKMVPRDGNPNSNTIKMVNKNWKDLKKVAIVIAENYNDIKNGI